MQKSRDEARVEFIRFIIPRLRDGGFKELADKYEAEAKELMVGWLLCGLCKGLHATQDDVAICFARLHRKK